MFLDHWRGSSRKLVHALVAGNDAARVGASDARPIGLARWLPILVAAVALILASGSDLQAQTVSFGAGPYTVNEPPQPMAPVVVPVTLSAAPTATVTIPITATATPPGGAFPFTITTPAGGACPGPTCTLTFAAGALTQNLTVATVADADAIDDAVTLGFGGLPAGVTAGAPATALVAQFDANQATVVSITTTAAQPVNGPFLVTITFSKPVRAATFTSGGMTIVGGGISNPAPVGPVGGLAATYTATITPTSYGTLTASVNGGATTGRFGLANVASAPYSFQVGGLNGYGPGT